MDSQRRAALATQPNMPVLGIPVSPATAAIIAVSVVGTRAVVTLWGKSRPSIDYILLAEK